MQVKKLLGATSEKIKQKILEKLMEVYPCDLYVKEVAEKVRISAPTASAYPKVLMASGDVEISRRLGSLHFIV